jgi:hypothetical protein
VKRLFLLLAFVSPLCGPARSRADLDATAMVRDRTTLQTEYEWTDYTLEDGKEVRIRIETLVCSLAALEYRKRPTKQLMDTMVDDLLCFEY